MSGPAMLASGMASAIAASAARKSLAFISVSFEKARDPIHKPRVSEFIFCHLTRRGGWRCIIYLLKPAIGTTRSGALPRWQWMRATACSLMQIYNARRTKRILSATAGGGYGRGSGDGKAAVTVWSVSSNVAATISGATIGGACIALIFPNTGKSSEQDCKQAGEAPLSDPS